MFSRRFAILNKHILPTLSELLAISALLWLVICLTFTIHNLSHLAKTAPSKSDLRSTYLIFEVRYREHGWGSLVMLFFR